MKAYKLVLLPEQNIQVKMQHIAIENKIKVNINFILLVRKQISYLKIEL